MSITMGKYEFEGPFAIEAIENRAGVYAMLRGRDEDIEILDLGEARELRHSLQKHRHYRQWHGEGDGVQLFVLYTPAILDDRRNAITSEIKYELENEPEMAA